MERKVQMSYQEKVAVVAKFIAASFSEDSMLTNMFTVTQIKEILDTEYPFKDRCWTAISYEKAADSTKRKIINEALKHMNGMVTLLASKSPNGERHWRFHGEKKMVAKKPRQNEVIKLAKIIEKFLLNKAGDAHSYTASFLVEAITEKQWKELKYNTSTRETKLTLVKQAFEHLKKENNELFIAQSVGGEHFYKMKKTIAKAELANFIQTHDLSVEKVKELLQEIEEEKKEKAFKALRDAHRGTIYRMELGQDTNYAALISEDLGALTINFIKNADIPDKVDFPNIIYESMVYVRQIEAPKYYLRFVSCLGDEIAIIRISKENPDEEPKLTEVKI